MEKSPTYWRINSGRKKGSASPSQLNSCSESLSHPFGAVLDVVELSAFFCFHVAEPIGAVAPSHVALACFTAPRMFARPGTYQRVP